METNNNFEKLKEYKYHNNNKMITAYVWLTSSTNVKTPLRKFQHVLALLLIHNENIISYF